MFIPAFRETTPDQNVVVRVAGVQVTLSVLSSIVAIATLSEAVPTTVTLAEARTVSFVGERIATWGGMWSALWTTTDCTAVATSPEAGAKICRVTAYVRPLVKTCWMVSEGDHGVSHSPSPSQSHRASRVAFGSESDEDDASKRIVVFATATGGETVNRAVGPEPVTATLIDVELERDPLAPVTTAVYDPEAVPLNVHVEVWVPAMLVGKHDAASPAGDEATVSETVPAKPPVDCRDTVDVADCPATNETLVGFAVSEKSGVDGGVTVTPIEVVWTKEPPVPLTVTVYDPAVEPLKVQVDV